MRTKKTLISPGHYQLGVEYRRTPGQKKWKMGKTFTQFVTPETEKDVREQLEEETKLVAQQMEWHAWRVFRV